MITEIKLAPSRYVLSRDSDGSGASGLMLQAIEYNGPTENNAIRVGSLCCVGSPYVSTYAKDDYWMTTPVTEILSYVFHYDDENESTHGTVRFKTRNSLYTLDYYA